MSDIDDHRALVEAAQAASAALFGPVPDWLEGAVVHYDITESGGDRYFTVWASEILDVIVTESRDGHWQVDADVVEAPRRAEITPTELRLWAVDLLRAATVYEQVAERLS